MTGESVSFPRARFDAILASLERMASGELEHELPVSGERDELDAMAHAVNVMARELFYRLQQIQDAQSSLVQSGRLAALGEVSSGLAHELNNPLTVIVGHAERVSEQLRELALGSPELTSLADSVERIERNAQRMSLIIRHIMEFSRQSVQVKKPVKINDVVERSFILISEQLRLKRIRVVTCLSAEDPVAMGDELKLEQVLINLFANARDAIVEARREEGGTIGVTSRVVGDGELEVEVADDGVGMSHEVQVKAFEPFFTTKGVGKGTGLGLSISHGIIEDHGGRISCRSEPGRGATFSIRLPRIGS